MRIALAAFAICLLICCIPLLAEEVRFDEGWLECAWTLDSQYLEIRAGIDDSSIPSETHMWVLTVHTHRFEDGVFAWQLHYSEAVDSVLVIPNDFLTARHFTTLQLGIDIEFHELGNELSLRIPSQGPIPRLVVEGDLIELHALWIQQQPLASMRVPLLDNLAAQPAGGGASLPGGETQPISSSPLPPLHSYEQGESISHQFVLETPPDSDDIQRVVLSYTLMRVHEDRANEFVRFAHVSFDFETEAYSYEIDTTELRPGIYRLLIESSNTALSFQMELEIE